MYKLTVTSEELDALVCFCELYDGADPRMVELAESLTDRLADMLSEEAA